MKKAILTLLIAVILAVSPAVAAPAEDEFKVLDNAAIVTLTDAQVIENYIDVLVELDALKAFHTASGFQPREYQKYKSLLKYRLLLLFEINKRKIEVPENL